MPHTIWVSDHTKLSWQGRSSGFDNPIQSTACSSFSYPREIWFNTDISLWEITTSFYIDAQIRKRVFGLYIHVTFRNSEENFFPCHFSNFVLWMVNGGSIYRGCTTLNTQLQFKRNTTNIFQENAIHTPFPAASEPRWGRNSKQV
jgi:hypothetical protein